jgi:hypothetical protein
MTDDDRQNSPVRRARNRALEAKLRYDHVFQGLSKKPEKALRATWQVYIWDYYNHIAGYRRTDHIKKIWTEPIADEVNIDMSLADLEEYQYGTESLQVEQWSKDLGRYINETRELPGVLEYEDLRVIQAKLDQCYHELGFDEPPKKVVNHSGPVGEEQPEWYDPERTDEIFRKFMETIDEGEDAPESLDDAVELVMADVSESEGGSA